jgi:hypothetical protein
MSLLKELNEAAPKVPLAPSASSLRALLVKKLKTLGFKLHSQETTPGALKAWLDHPTVVVKLEDLAKVLPGQPKVRRKSYGDEVLETDFYEIEKQGPKNIYLAVYRSGQAGVEYGMGMDT